MLKNKRVVRQEKKVKKPTRKGLSAGVGDGRVNGLRETTRGLRAGKVRRSVMKNASSEEIAAFKRIWKLVKNTLNDFQTRKSRVEKIRHLVDTGDIEQESSFEGCVDGLLGQKVKCEDPDLKR